MQSRQPIQVTFRLALCCLVVIAPLSGCRSTYRGAPLAVDVPSLGTSYLEPYDADIDETPSDHALTLSPDQVVDYRNIQYVPIGLQECIQQALASSQVFRDLGGTVISTPRALDSTFDPALIYTHPTFGEDAALSAFDAVFSQGVFFEKNDRPFNTSFTGDTRGIFQQDLLESNLQLTKLSATGTRFTSRGIVNYDDNNQAGNRFFHSWEPIIENEFRHPLLQGSGSEFNRIAGPSQVPGAYNGILIARTNTEMSLAEFETAVRDFIVNVENAYWDLYYAYRELNAQTDARDAAYEVYKNTEADAEEERVSTLEKASAYEQYLRFEAALVESMEGRPAEGTQAGSGSSGGVFRRNVGVRIAERRLRHFLGMTITDGSLLQPNDQPNTIPVVFDWNESMDIAISQRPEIRRQRWVIKQRELQLVASKNFLQPRLDLVGRHRFRGLGRDLTGGEPFEEVINSPNNNDNVSGGLADLATGNFQEWQLGVEMRVPVGLRQAHAGVRNAELGLLRERVILKEQERKIALDLSNAVAEVRRSSSAMSLAEQRYRAAVDYRAQAAERIERGRAQFDVLLEAQRRVLEAQVQFINAEVENGIAVRNVHVERGTLLGFHGVQLSENQSDPAAYSSADRRHARRSAPMSYVVRNSTVAKPKATENLVSTTPASPPSIAVPEMSLGQASQSPELVPSGAAPRQSSMPSSPDFATIPPIVTAKKTSQNTAAQNLGTNANAQTPTNTTPNTTQGSSRLTPIPMLAKPAVSPQNLPPSSPRRSSPGNPAQRVLVPLNPVATDSANAKLNGIRMPATPSESKISNDWSGIRIPAATTENKISKDWSGIRVPGANTTAPQSSERYAGIIATSASNLAPAKTGSQQLQGAVLPANPSGSNRYSSKPGAASSLQGAALR